MRGALILLAVFGLPAFSQLSKEELLGRRVAEDLERRDGRNPNLALEAAVTRVEKAIAAASGLRPMEVRLTESSEPYARVLPRNVLYISVGMLARLHGEAELAALLAHKLAHPPEDRVTGFPGWPGGRIYRDRCPLASSVAHNSGEARIDAIAARYLSAAGYR